MQSQKSERKNLDINLAIETFRQRWAVGLLDNETDRDVVHLECSLLTPLGRRFQLAGKQWYGATSREALNLSQIKFDLTIFVDPQVSNDAVGQMRFSQGIDFEGEVTWPTVYIDVALPAQQFQNLAIAVSSADQNCIVSLGLGEGIEVDSDLSRIWRIDSKTPVRVLTFSCLSSIQIISSKESISALRDRKNLLEKPQYRHLAAAELTERLRDELDREREHKWEDFSKSQYYRIATALVDQAAEYAESHQLDEWGFDEHFGTALDIVDGVYRAVYLHDQDERRRRNLPGIKREGIPIRFWGRPNLGFAINQGYESEYFVAVHRDELDEATSAYLSRGYLFSEELERIVIEAYAFCEIANFAEELKKPNLSNGLARFFSHPYWSTKGNNEKLAGALFKRWLMKCALILAPLPIFGLLGALDPDSIWTIMLGVYLTGLGFRLAVGVVRWIFLVRAPDDPKRAAYELLQKMLPVYSALSDPVFSRDKVRAIMSSSTNLGAVWPGGMYALLGRYCERVDKLG